MVRQRGRANTDTTFQKSTLQQENMGYDSAGMERARAAWMALTESPCVGCCAVCVIIFVLAALYCGAWAGIFCLWYFTSSDGPWLSLLMSAWITPFVVLIVSFLLLVVCVSLSWCWNALVDICRTPTDSIVHTHSKPATFASPV